LSLSLSCFLSLSTLSLTLCQHQPHMNASTRTRAQARETLSMQKLATNPITSHYETSRGGVGRTGTARRTLSLLHTCHMCVAPWPHPPCSIRWQSPGDPWCRGNPASKRWPGSLVRPSSQYRNDLNIIMATFGQAIGSCVVMK